MTFGKGNPELILTTRWVATLEPGPNYDCMKTFAEQRYVPEHLQYYRRMLDRGELLIGGPYATWTTSLIIFGDSVSNYRAARSIIDRDPAVAAGVLSARVEEWFSNAIGGGHATFFPEDSVSVRENARLFVETGYGVIAEEVGAKIVGEIAEDLGSIFGHREERKAEELGREIGGALGDDFGKDVADVVTELQGADDRPRPGPPDSGPPTQPLPESDLPDGAPLPYFTTRWMCLLYPGPNYVPGVLTPKQQYSPEHVRCIEGYVLDGRMLVAGPVTTFFHAFLVFSERVTSYAEAKRLIDADLAVEKGVLASTIVEWCTNVRKGESSGYFDADSPDVRAAGQKLIDKGFFPIRPDET